MSYEKYRELVKLYRINGDEYNADCGVLNLNAKVSNKFISTRLNKSKRLLKAAQFFLILKGFHI